MNVFLEKDLIKEEIDEKLEIKYWYDKFILKKKKQIGVNNLLILLIA